MCVGLGGPIKVTERGDKISGCVHDNADENGNKPNEGMVETELYDGSGFGKNLIVRVEFNRQDKEVWYMNGQPSSRKKVREKMKELNIQVDNPLQFLPQDKVGQFSNMSPVQLLKETERAIGPETCEKHERLIIEDKTLKEAKHQLNVEEKALADLEKQNEVLYADVERWQRYEANMKQLAQVEGKRAWMIFDEKYEGYKRADDEKQQQKRLKKALEAEKRQMREELAPLENLVKKAVTSMKAQAGDVHSIEEKALEACDRIEAIENNAADAKHGIGQVDKKLAKIVKSRDGYKRQLQETQSEVEAEQRRLAAEFGSSAEQAKTEAQNAVAALHAEYSSKCDELMNHDLSAERQQVGRVNQQIAALGDPVGMKMKIVYEMNHNTVRLADWCQKNGFGEDRVIGPMLMVLDLPNKEHQRLSEQAFNWRTLSSFLARTDDARDELNQVCRREKYNINIYRNKGEPFKPRPSRVPSADLAQFGITAWLDEALVIRDDLRGEILSFLAQQMGVDRYLLGTSATISRIDVLQQYLAERGCDSVEVLTPERTYSFNRSRYGSRKVTASSSIPHQPKGLFSVAINEAEKKRLEAELAQAECALKERETARSAVVAQVEKLKNRRDQALARSNEIKKIFVRFKTMQSRIAGLEEKVRAEQDRIDNFKSEEQKAEYRKRLVDAHHAALGQLSHVALSSISHSEAMTRLAGARLAAGAAEAMLADRTGDTEELDEKIRRAQAEYDVLYEKAKTLAAAIVPTLKSAREKAPEMELKPVSGDPKDKDGPQARSPEGQAIWDSLPDTMEEVDDRIAELEAETSSNMGDASAVRQYKERCSKIEEMKGRVQQCKASVESQSQLVRQLEAEWKPELNEMIKSVDAKFAECFARFRCQGEIRLSDGRKLNEDGDPVGEDDYEQYKIHILVKWRDSEKLHILGEAGRDSGGERSVATMVYLISLQDINPAPFRVVDEINQAMDSTNERNIFTCITNACRDSGKQYFLLTPKLLPDLDYGKDCAIQLVFNGPYMERQNTFRPALFV
mgnify:CR=1 FL=1